ncbi:nucleotide pyrophosphohydrolase [Chloroflexota bacterium]
MEKLINRIRLFNKERDWEQFHTPKNLAMSLVVEVAEIIELFQWMPEEQINFHDSSLLSQLEEEIGDVMIYLTNLADKFNINPLEAANKKIDINNIKYPANIVKGKSDKYTHYLND